MATDLENTIGYAGNKAPRLPKHRDFGWAEVPTLNCLRLQLLSRFNRKHGPRFQISALQHKVLAEAEGGLRPWCVVNGDRLSIDHALYVAAARAPLEQTGPRTSALVFDQSAFMALVLGASEAAGST